jgi:hypothetical protein
MKNTNTISLIFSVKNTYMEYTFKLIQMDNVKKKYNARQTQLDDEESDQDSAEYEHDLRTRRLDYMEAREDALKSRTSYDYEAPLRNIRNTNRLQRAYEINVRIMKRYERKRIREERRQKRRKEERTSELRKTKYQKITDRFEQTVQSGSLKKLRSLVKAYGIYLLKDDTLQLNAAIGGHTNIFTFILNQSIHISPHAYIGAVQSSNIHMLTFLCKHKPPDDVEGLLTLASLKRDWEMIDFLYPFFFPKDEIKELEVYISFFACESDCIITI